MSITFEYSTHRQIIIFPLLSPQMWTVQRINDLYRKNLLRLLKASGLEKKQFAERIGIEPDHFSQLISEKNPTNIGKKTLAKLCNAFQVSPRYFDQEESEPLPLTAREERAVYGMREAEKVGIAAAEQLELMIDGVVTAIKKKSEAESEDATIVSRNIATLTQQRKPTPKKKKSA